MLPPLPSPSTGSEWGMSLVGHSPPVWTGDVHCCPHQRQAYTYTSIREYICLYIRAQTPLPSTIHTAGTSRASTVYNIYPTTSPHPQALLWPPGRSVVASRDGAPRPAPLTKPRVIIFVCVMQNNSSGQLAPNVCLLSRSVSTNDHDVRSTSRPERWPSLFHIPRVL